MLDYNIPEVMNQTLKRKKDSSKRILSVYVLINLKPSKTIHNKNPSDTFILSKRVLQSFRFFCKATYDFISKTLRFYDNRCVEEWERQS